MNTKEKIKEEFYFTPEIEDLRIGYEYYYKNAYGTWNTFSSIIDFTETPLDDDSIKEYFEQELKSMRVPYLTRQQIEQEGWELITTNFAGKGEDGVVFTKQGMYLIFSFKFKTFEIMRNASPETDYLFNGFCKDINTFRTIIKLLKI